MLALLPILGWPKDQTDLGLDHSGMGYDHIGPTIAILKWQGSIVSEFCDSSRHVKPVARIGNKSGQGDGSIFI
jgi:hypothetical protein